MTIALTFFSTFSLCLIINIIFLIIKKNKTLQTQGQLIQISKELENARQEKEQQKNELFFQIKKNSKGTFLKRDASGLMLEVDQNVMLEVE